MTIPTLESLPAFRTATGAIRTGSLMGLSTYPRGMQYAGTGRLQPVGGWYDDYVKPFLPPVADIAGDIVRQLLTSTVIKLKVEAGYKVVGVTTLDGRQVVKMTDPSGRTVYVDQDGRETFATAATTTSERPLGAYAKAGIGVGVLAAAALAAFLILRRK